MYFIDQRVELIRPLIGRDIEPMTRGTVDDVYGSVVVVIWDTGETTEIENPRDFLALA